MGRLRFCGWPVEESGMHELRNAYFFIGATFSGVFVLIFCGSVFAFVVGVFGWACILLAGGRGGAALLLSRSIGYEFVALCSWLIFWSAVVKWTNLCLCLTKECSLNNQRQGSDLSWRCVFGALFVSVYCCGWCVWPVVGSFMCVASVLQAA